MADTGRPVPVPVANRYHCATVASMRSKRSFESKAMPSLARNSIRTDGWSCRLRPTPGRSCTARMPSCSISAAGPTPESSRSWGELYVPPDRMTSRLA